MTLLDGWVPEAVIFDCDGLLMDTEPCWTIAESTLFERRGLTFGLDEKAAVIGRSLADIGEVMAGLLGEPGSGSGIATELLELVIDVVASKAEAMPFAPELVELARKRVPVGVASNSPRALLETALARGGFTACFDISVTAEDVPRPKPAPDMYEIGCQMLRTHPSATLAFEDSVTGVRSARAAGVRVIGIPTLVTPDFDADLVVSALTDHDVCSWIESWPTT